MIENEDEDQEKQEDNEEEDEEDNNNKSFNSSFHYMNEGLNNVENNKNDNNKNRKVRNWIAAIQQNIGDDDDETANKFKNLISNLHKKTPLIYALGGLEKSPSTNKMHIHTCFFFQTQVYRSTLVRYLKKFEC
jgi:CRISPR/Cas system CSM-associated protein Csm2 small subunit